MLRRNRMELEDDNLFRVSVHTMSTFIDILHICVVMYDVSETDSFLAVSVVLSFLTTTATIPHTASSSFCLTSGASGSFGCIGVKKHGLSCSS